MNDIIDTITCASIIVLLGAGCTAIKQPVAVQTQAPVQTIEQFFSRPEPQVKRQSARAKIQPPNWPPHLHTGAADESPVFMLIQPLDRLILVDDAELTF